MKLNPEFVPEVTKHLLNAEDKDYRICFVTYTSNNKDRSARVANHFENEGVRVILHKGRESDFLRQIADANDFDERHVAVVTNKDHEAMITILCHYLSYKLVIVEVEPAD